MNKNLIVSIVVIIIYAILCGTVITVYSEKSSCTSKTPCIHFCSTNSKEVSKTFLFDEFMKSESGKNFIRLL